MTFEDALDLKDTYPKDFKSERGNRIIFLVAPKTFEFLKKWLADFNNDFKDETAKKYCQDNNHWVYWKEIY